MTTRRMLFGTALVLSTLMTHPAAARQEAYVQFMGAYGEDYGTATLSQTPNGVLIRTALKGLPSGEVGLRIHAVGQCTPPFSSAGGVFDPGGDMPNIVVSPIGEAALELLNNQVTLERGRPNSLIGGRGTALVVHVPRGGRGSDATIRMACGVIRP